MTLAEQWRRQSGDPENWSGINKYISRIHRFDPCSFFQITELGLVIVFSDKSKHRMDVKKGESNDKRTH